MRKFLVVNTILLLLSLAVLLTQNTVYAADSCSEKYYECGWAIQGSTGSTYCGTCSAGSICQSHKCTPVPCNCCSPKPNVNASSCSLLYKSQCAGANGGNNCEWDWGCAQSCSDNFYLITATPEPTETPEPTVPPGSPTPTPYIKVVVKNPQGQRVMVDKVCRVICNASVASCVKGLCKNNSKVMSFPKATGKKLGAKINLQTGSDNPDSPLILLGVTPSVQGTLKSSCPQVGGACYVWNSTSWTTGVRKVVFVVATPTGIPPTGTPTSTPPPGATNTPTPTRTPTPPPGATNTPTPTRTPTPTSVPPTATPVPGCLCKTNNTCNTVCAFDKYSFVTYGNPMGCTRETTIVGPTPDAAKKTLYCQRNMRTKGDVDGIAGINFNDYLYYVSTVNGGGIPDFVNADVNGDGTVSPNDRAIIIRSLSQ